MKHPRRASREPLKGAALAVRQSPRRRPGWRCFLRQYCTSVPWKAGMNVPKYPQNAQPTAFGWASIARIGLIHAAPGAVVGLTAGTPQRQAT